MPVARLASTAWGHTFSTKARGPAPAGRLGKEAATPLAAPAAGAAAADFAALIADGAADEFASGAGSSSAPRPVGPPSAVRAPAASNPRRIDASSATPPSGGVTAASRLPPSWRSMTRARPMPPLRVASCMASCWSSSDWYMRDSSLSNMPPLGVASRIDLSTCWSNSASNCLAASLVAAGEPSFETRRRPARELGSRALIWLKSEAIRSPRVRPAARRWPSWPGGWRSARGGWRPGC